MSDPTDTSPAPPAEPSTEAAPTTTDNTDNNDSRSADDQQSKKRRLGDDGAYEGTASSAEIPSDEGTRRRDVSTFTAFMTREKLQELVIAAAMDDDSLFKKLREAAHADPAHRKVFLRGIPWETTNDEVMQFMGQYGTITEGSLVIDRNTGRSKGYAFVTYATMAEAQNALQESTKEIGGRTVVASLAAKRDHDSGSGVRPSPAATADPEDISQRKIFVRGLSWDTTTPTLQQVYTQFGEVEEAIVVTDKHSGQSKGYGFVIFAHSHGAKNAIGQEVQCDGRTLHCNLAANRSGQRNNNNNNNQHHQQNYQQQYQQQGYGQQYGGGGYGQGNAYQQQYAQQYAAAYAQQQQQPGYGQYQQ